LRVRYYTGDVDQQDAGGIHTCVCVCVCVGEGWRREKLGVSVLEDETPPHSFLAAGLVRASASSKSSGGVRVPPSLLSASWSIHFRETPRLTTAPAFIHPFSCFFFEFSKFPPRLPPPKK
jgi:hypothetical protein